MERHFLNTFLEKNKVPKLIITILKLELFFDNDKKIIDSEIKNYLDKLPELYTISYVFLRLLLKKNLEKF